MSYEIITFRMEAPKYFIEQTVRLTLTGGKVTYGRVKQMVRREVDGEFQWLYIIILSKGRIVFRFEDELEPISF